MIGLDHKYLEAAEVAADLVDTGGLEALHLGEVVMGEDWRASS